jgi:hypothetical protein
MMNHHVDFNMTKFKKLVYPLLRFTSTHAPSLYEWYIVRMCEWCKSREIIFERERIWSARWIEGDQTNLFYWTNLRLYQSQTLWSTHILNSMKKSEQNKILYKHNVLYIELFIIIFWISIYSSFVSIEFFFLLDTSLYTIVYVCLFLRYLMRKKLKKHK